MTTLIKNGVVITADPQDRVFLKGWVLLRDDRIEALAGGSASDLGTGGMTTKIQAARTATGHGIAMAILNGAEPELLYDLLEGKGPGTLFLPAQKNC